MPAVLAACVLRVHKSGRIHCMVFAARAVGSRCACVCVRRLACVCVCTPEHGDRESLSSQSSARNFSGRGGGGGVEGLRPTKLPSTPQVTYLQWSARGQLAGPSPFICIFISFCAASFPVFDVAGQDPYSIRIISSCLACHSRCLACLAKNVHLISAWHFRYHHHYQHRHCHPV